jgi:glucokinase
MLLAGDIGGTKTDLAVFTVERGPRAPIARKRFLSRDYPSLEANVREFIAGGIPQRIPPRATDQWQLLLSRFEDKGRLSPMLARVPVHVVVEPVALLGTAIHGLDIVNFPGRAGV